MKTGKVELKKGCHLLFKINKISKGCLIPYVKGCTHTISVKTLKTNVFYNIQGTRKYQEIRNDNHIALYT